MTLRAALPLVAGIFLCGCVAPQNLAEPQTPQEEQRSEDLSSSEPSPSRISGTSFHPSFRFDATLPSGWQVEYVPGTQALNLYNPHASGATDLEKSQIFIRTFTANQFLTLGTVTIHHREDRTVNGHVAVRYDIEKKPNVAPFPSQPSWRNVRHEVTDVRFASTNPSIFFVFARNPSLDPRLFEDFLDSLAFHNDQSSYQLPLARARERVTKKPFGLAITPATSPVQPERFSGIHVGTDFEAFPEEPASDVPVAAICGGKILQRRTADGYGGLVVQECQLGDDPITVVYGHLAIDSVDAASVGTMLSPGQQIGMLGEGSTPETDGERKHLHLGIHRGGSIDFRGYVQSEAESKEWTDPLSVLP